VRLLNEETRRPREVEWVGAAGAVGGEHGRDSGPDERRLRQLRVASCCEGADFDHRLRHQTVVVDIAAAEVPVGERVTVDVEGEIRRGRNLEVGASRLSWTQTMVSSARSPRSQTGVRSTPSPERRASLIRVVDPLLIIEVAPFAVLERSVARDPAIRPCWPPWSSHWHLHVTGEAATSRRCRTLRP
jgi:hypothetical protein